MSLLSQSIPNLINGVSQQPFTLRLASQAEEQINALSSVVSGMQKRPGLRFNAKFRDAPLSSAYIHTINRDARERYTVVIENGDLAVYDLQGNRQTVNFPQGKAYLNAADPEHDFSCVTVADYTFIVNKTVTVQKSAERSPRRPYEGLFWVKQGAYSSTYKVEVEGHTSEYATLDGGSAANAVTIQTSVIAANLAANLEVPGGISSNLTMQVLGSSVYFSRMEYDFSMATYDPLGDNALELIKGRVQRFSDLPARAVNGMKVKVAGTEENSFDDYWVEYEADPTVPFGGIWKESVAPDTQVSMDNATMPHLLVRDADGVFSFEEAVFDPRKCGDEESIPWPSFVGQKIADTVFHRNRLGFLSDENVVLSQAGEFFKFFASSAIQTVDTDPIDVAVSHVKVSLLKAAVPFNETLMLFSDQSQFQMAKSDILAPRTVGINLTTEFACNTLARPVGVGSNIYFAQSRGASSTIREYYADPDTAQNDATDVTSHCPSYIPGDVRKLAASSNDNMLVALSSAQKDTLYVYRFYWARQEKMQSSWSKWVLPPGSSVLNCDFIDNSLYLVVSRPDGCYLESIPLMEGLDPGVHVYLDRWVGYEPTNERPYDPERNVTLITLPWVPQEGEEWIAFAGVNDATYRRGTVVPATWNGTAFEVPGRMTSYTFGVSYAMRYTFSPFVVREQAPGGQGMQAVSEGRLQLRGMSVAYAQTGYFRAEVTPRGRDTYRYNFTGRILGLNSNVVGEVATETGTFRFPLMSKNDQVKITLVNDTPLPSAFLSAEWEGFYTIRSRRG